MKCATGVRCRLRRTFAAGTSDSAHFDDRQAFLDRLRAKPSTRLEVQATLVTGRFGIVTGVLSRLYFTQQIISEKRVWEVQRSRTNDSGSQSEQKEPDQSSMKCCFCQKNGRVALHCRQKKAGMKRSLRINRGQAEAK